MHLFKLLESLINMIGKCIDSLNFIYLKESSIIQN